MPRAPHLPCVALSLGLFACAAAATQVPEAAPPPGEYRVDKETVKAVPTGRQTFEVTARLDSATGTTTVTSQVTGNPPDTRSIPGKPPARHCHAPMGLQAAPTVTPGHSCRDAGNTYSSSRSSYASACMKSISYERFKRRADGHWEFTRWTVAEDGPAVSTTAPRPPMTPLLDASKARLLEEVQARIAGARNAQEAETYRQHLANLRKGQLTEVANEVWVRTGNRCTAVSP
jgi:hypothetical protein